MRSDGQGVTAGEGSGVTSRRVLIIGFGNTLRRDDGAGAVAARLMAADQRLAGEDIEVREAYQLLPEMALDIGEVSLVVFVDADLGASPGSIEVHAIEPLTAARAGADPRGEPGASSHHVGPGGLVAMAVRLSGAAPQAVALGVGVADVELGEGLSPAVEAALPKVVDIVAGLVAEHRAGR